MHHRKQASAVPCDPELYAEIKDKIYKQYKRKWSAYASGKLVQEYSRQMRGKHKRPYTTNPNPSSSRLRRWFRENWIDITTGLPCGSAKSPIHYPTCRPRWIANGLTTAEKRQADAIKQKVKSVTARYPSFFVYSKKKYE
jgi:Family of unknown function (DUF5872)